MTISLLHIVVPTILILVVVILYINSSKKQLMKEIASLKTQLEKLDNVPSAAAVEQISVNEKTEIETSEPVEVKADENKETKDEPADENAVSGASEYNTGKSGKIYTKEELELLIKE